MEICVLVEFDRETGSYGASSPDYPVDGIGKSEAEAVDRFRHAMANYVEFMADSGEALPLPRYRLRNVTIPLNKPSSGANADKDHFDTNDP